MARWPAPVTDEDVLRFIKFFAAAEGYAPTLQEIARGVGLSAKTAALHHVRKLEARGAIRRGAGKGKARTLVVVQ